MQTIQVSVEEHTEAALKPMSADVPQSFFDDKQYFGVTWAFLIREGIKSLKLQEKLMQEKFKPEINWRLEAKRKLEELNKLYPR